MTRKAARSSSPLRRNSGAGIVIPASVKKVRRKCDAGELSIIQTDDELALATILERASLTGHSLDRPGNCRLIAYVGDQPAGVIGLDTDLDNAVIRLFFVLEPYRRRKIGSHLLTAARTAARTRGVRTIHTPKFEASEFLQAAGFIRAKLTPEAFRSVSGHPDAQFWELDISQDGIIIR